MKKRVVALFLSAMMLISMTIQSIAANTPSFNPWTDNNIYQGEEETSTLASKLDRANLAYILYEAFDFSPVENKIDIKDVDESNWAYEYIQTIVSKGIMELDSERFYPDEYVTRQEIPQYFQFLNISYPAIKDLPFADVDNGDEEYANMFKRFLTAGYLQPVSGDYVFPKRIITITETINILNKMFPNIQNKVLKHSKYDGHYLMKDNNTYLGDTEIAGDLIITEGVLKTNINFADNEVTLENVKVSGNIYIMGSGLYGKFVLRNVSAENVVLMAEDPIIISLKNCEIASFEMGNSLANVISDERIEINRK